MSSNPYHNQPQIIPFGSPPIQQQQNINNPSMDRFPSTSQFNQALPLHHSVASINYNDQQNNYNQLASQKQIKNQEQPEEQLQKIRLQKNQIDQDEILRMFRQQENKIQKSKNLTEKKKGHTSGHGGSIHKQKKPTLAHQSSKRQHSQDNLHRKKQQIDQQPLPFISKTSSYKEVKVPTNTLYASISTSQQIRQLVMQYKIQYRTSLYDPDWQKQRYKLKQQFFQQLCIGVQQMRQKAQCDLSKQEAQVLQKINQIKNSINKLPYDFGVFKYCRNMVIEIDLQLFMHFHQKNKQPLSKDYKGQYKFLINNLKDPQNYELRRRILTHRMDAQTIKVANEIQFFNQAKRNQIKSKQQKLLKQFSVDHEKLLLKAEQEQQRQQQRVTQNIKYDSYQNQAKQYQYTSFNNQLNENNASIQQKQNQPFQSYSISNLLSYNKYLQESTLTQLQQLLSDNQMERMRKRLEEDLKGDCRQKMLSKFDTLIIENV